MISRAQASSLCARPLRSVSLTILMKLSAGVGQLVVRMSSPLPRRIVHASFRVRWWRRDYSVALQPAFHLRFVDHVAPAYPHTRKSTRSQKPVERGSAQGQLLEQIDRRDESLHVHAPLVISKPGARYSAAMLSGLPSTVSGQWASLARLSHLLAHMNVPESASISGPITATSDCRGPISWQHPPPSPYSSRGP